MQPYVFTSKNKAKRIFQSDIRCKDVDKKVKKQIEKQGFSFFWEKGYFCTEIVVKVKRKRYTKIKNI